MVTPNATHLQISADDSFSNPVIENTGTYRTSEEIQVASLTRGITYYARVRHSTVETGYTPWSTTRQFSITTRQKWISYINYDTFADVSIEAVCNVHSYQRLCAVGYVSIGGYLRAYVSFWTKEGVCLNQWYLNEAVPSALFDVKITFGGGNIIAVGHKNNQGLLLRLDPGNNNVTFEKTYTNSSVLYSRFLGISLYSDGVGFYSMFICGMGWTASVVYSGIYAKLSASNYNVVFWKKIEGNVHVQLRGIFYSSVGDVFISGGSYQDTKNNWLSSIYRFGDDGTFYWQKHIDAVGFFTRSIAKTNDTNSIYVVGTTLYNSVSRAAIVKMNREGTVIWKKILTMTTDTVVFRDIVFGSDASIYACGAYINGSYQRPFICKITETTDGEGSTITVGVSWSRYLYAASHNDVCLYQGICIDAANNIFTCGDLYYNTKSKVLLTGFDPDGPIPGVCIHQPDLEWVNPTISAIDLPTNIITSITTVSDHTSNITTTQTQNSAGLPNYLEVTNTVVNFVYG